MSNQTSNEQLAQELRMAWNLFAAKAQRRSFGYAELNKELGSTIRAAIDKLSTANEPCADEAIVDALVQRKVHDGMTVRPALPPPALQVTPALAEDIRGVCLSCGQRAVVQPAQPPSDARADTERLDWLEEARLRAVPFSEPSTLDEGMEFLWWQIVDGKKSVSGHPLGTLREAIDAAMKVQPGITKEASRT